MRSGGRRSLSTVLTAVMAAALLAAGPADASAPSRATAVQRAAPDETAVRAGCRRTSGRLQLTYGPRVGGTVAYQIDARHVPGRSSWEVTMLAEEERGGDEETVASSVRASRGQWSIVGEIDVSGLDGRLFYGAFALRSGDPGGGFCVAGVSHRRSPVAFGYSRFARVQGLAVTRTEQGRVKVRYTQGGHPGDRWRVIVEAADGDSAVGVLLTETVGPRGRLQATVGLGRLDDPRILVDASDPEGHHAVLGLDLPDRTTTSRLSTYRSMTKTSRAFHRTALSRAGRPWW